MNHQRSSDGYAMLAALLVMVLAATFALIVVGAVHSLQVVERSDAAGRRVERAAGKAVTATTRTLRWRPGAWSDTVEGQDPPSRESWQATWAPAPPLAGDEWPRRRVRVSAAAGGARRDDELTMELRAEPWAMGVTCSGDAEIRAPLEVSGSGVYVGGCLRGREQVGFLQGAGPVTPAGDPGDGVRGDVFPAAAVRGGAGVFAEGIEIHEAPEGGVSPLDTDQHTGQPVPAEWLAPPSAEFLAAAAAIAASPGDALIGARLSLDQIQFPQGADADGGTCVLLPAMDEVTIDGSAPLAAGRLLLVVRGDAVLGEPGETVAFSGGLVVCGHLLVRGGVHLEGSVHAGSMTIDGPTRIDMPSDWRQRPLPGAAVPTLLEYGG